MSEFPTKINRNLVAAFSAFVAALIEFRSLGVLPLDAVGFRMVPLCPAARGFLKHLSSTHLSDHARAFTVSRPRSNGENALIFIHLCRVTGLTLADLVFKYDEKQSMR